MPAGRYPSGPVPALGELRRFPVIDVDLNAGHLAVAVVAPDGNVLGVPFRCRWSWPGCPPPPGTGGSATPSASSSPPRAGTGRGPS